MAFKKKATIDTEGIDLPVADYYDLSFEQDAYEEEDPIEQRFAEMFPNGLTQEQIDAANAVMWK